MKDFFETDNIRQYYDEISRIYSVAFAGPPWYEVGKCPDPLIRCIGGLSKLALGETCQMCIRTIEEPAYTYEELSGRFEYIGRTRPTKWYLESMARDLTLAALAWVGTDQEIANEKYPDVPEMKDWLSNQLAGKPVIWLDDVFANRTVKPSGNLDNFVGMCKGFGRMMDVGLMAFRTISPQMLSASRRFGRSARIWEKEQNVPDRRNFVTIDLERPQK